MQAALRGCAGLHVLPLHAQLSAAEQRLAFQPPPRGTTKVILATDIADNFPYISLYLAYISPTSPLYLP